ncbi:MAG: SUF system Fe-S cluster assembly protein [Pseudomonadota bacterium]
MDEEVVRKTGGSAPTTEELRERVIEALKNIYDPEIPVNIFDLGLIYRVDIKENGFAEVDMTLTAPGCPVAQTFPGMVEGSVKLVPGISDAVVELVWDPPWRQDMISEAARLELGLI